MSTIYTMHDDNASDTLSLVRLRSIKQTYSSNLVHIKERASAKIGKQN